MVWADNFGAQGEWVFPCQIIQINPDSTFRYIVQKLDGEILEVYNVTKTRKEIFPTFMKNNQEV